MNVSVPFNILLSPFIPLKLLLVLRWAYLCVYITIACNLHPLPFLPPALPAPPSGMEEMSSFLNMWVEGELDLPPTPPPRRRRSSSRTSAISDSSALGGCNSHCPSIDNTHFYTHLVPPIHPLAHHLGHLHISLAQNSQIHWVFHDTSLYSSGLFHLHSTLCIGLVSPTSSPAHTEHIHTRPPTKYLSLRCSSY